MGLFEFFPRAGIDNSYMVRKGIDRVTCRRKGLWLFLFDFEIERFFCKRGVKGVKDGSNRADTYMHRVRGGCLIGSYDGFERFLLALVYQAKCRATPE